MHQPSPGVSQGSLPPREEQQEQQVMVIVTPGEQAPREKVASRSITARIPNRFAIGFLAGLALGLGLALVAALYILVK
jgi:hypothetical protein